jgi:hypothetical protein
MGASPAAGVRSINDGRLSLDLTHPIKKWVPTVGLWDTSTDTLIYLGPEEITRQPHGQPFGLLVSDVSFQEGKVEVTVVLPKRDDGGVGVDACGGVLFGYRSENDEYRFVTLGAWGFAYALGRFLPELGAWVRINAVGSAKKSSSRKALSPLRSNTGSKCHLRGRWI